MRDVLDDRTSILATDLNRPRLDISSNKFEKYEHIRFQTVDAMELPFTASSYDAIICQFGVMFFPDKERSYREARRVLPIQRLGFVGGEPICQVNPRNNCGFL